MSKRKRSRLKRAFTPEEIAATKFKVLDFSDEWLRHIGRPDQRIRMIVHGASGQGKTRYILKLAKYLTQFGKVYYNSYEEGKSQTLKKAIIESNIVNEVPRGSLIFGDQDSFDDMLRRMKNRNSPRFLFIDSTDYMNLTKEQYQTLHEELPTKGIILISWSTGKEPKTAAAKAIYYMVDIKVRVHEFRAFCRSRYGGIEPFIIWPEYWADKAAEAQERAESQKPNPTPAKPRPGPSRKPRPAIPQPTEEEEDYDEEQLLLELSRPR